jgi:HAMP domain-containing protein
MLRNLKLGQKLTLFMVGIFLLIVLFCGAFLSLILQRNAEQVVADQANLLMQAMLSVREYTSTQVNPELAPRLETDSEFLPQTVPAYSAREVVENLRKNQAYANFLYKEATLNPSNLRDKADDFEAKIVENFRRNPKLKQVQGFRQTPSGDLFYIARPLKVSKESCLRCHGAPEAAPKSQLITYGDKNGYGWKLNEIVSAQITSVPASKIFNAARQLQLWVMGILSLFLLLAVFGVNYFLRFTVTNPLKKMSQLAQRISTGDMTGEFKHEANDEIGILAAALNRMKTSLQIAMDMLKSKPE